MAKRNRTCILLLFLALAALVECNKSEGDKPVNLFGAPPQVSDVVITKVRRTFHCEPIVILCSKDPNCNLFFGQPCPGAGCCDCCCQPDQHQSQDVEQDLVTATARIHDNDGASNILVVILRFIDNVIAGSTALPQQVSLEMFDSGSQDLVPEAGVQLSGDLTAGDGIYSRSFYFTFNTFASAGTCVEDTDNTNLGGTLSTYGSSAPVSPSSTKEYRFTVQAIDFQGNIAGGPEIPLAIQGTFRDTTVLAYRACGAFNGKGGCASRTEPF